MSKMQELREKRASVWESAKAFLNEREGASLSAEDVAIYEGMEQEVVDLGQTLDRLERQAQMDRVMETAAAKPFVGRPEKKNRESEAFFAALRNRINPMVQNALRLGEDADGGYLAPDEYEARLIESLQEANVLRTLCHVIQTASGERKIPVVASKGSAVWLDEGSAFEESDVKFAQTSLSAYKLGTILKISDELLNDSVFDLESYIAKEFGRRLGAAEEESFLTGNGQNKPTGLLESAELGVTSNSTTNVSFDEIIDLYHSLRLPYRKQATFLVHDSTVKTLRKVKDAQGQYIWQPSVKAGTPDTVLNRPVVTSQYMPLPDAGQKTILFGDFSYYWIADRQGRTFKRLSELYAASGQVGFLAWQRLDAKLILPEAVKVLVQKS